MGFLIDTCVWIDVERGLLAPTDVAALTSNEPVYLSPITIAELRFGAEVAQEPRKPAQPDPCPLRIRDRGDRLHHAQRADPAMPQG